MQSITHECDVDSGRGQCWTSKRNGHDLDMNGHEVDVDKLDNTSRQGQVMGVHGQVRT